MASVLRRKSTRAAAPENRARRLVRDATKQADRLTLHVLKTGRSLVSGGQADLAAQSGKQKQRGGSGAGLPAAALAQVAPIGLKADPTPKLQAAAPMFGDVLRSIGAAVAVTQTALDDTALESLKTLAGQKVDVPVLIVQTLLDDGTPDTSSTGVQITTASMPLTSIITPSMQQVAQMTLRMDMSVASFDATSGIKFNQNMASAGASFGRGGFGFALSMSNTNVNAQFSNMSDYSSGSVLMSMDIVDRTGFQIPTPLEYGIGANLLVRLSGVTQVPVTPATAPPTVIRIATLTVSKVKTTGAVVALDSSVDDYTVVLPPELQYVMGPGAAPPGSTTPAPAAGTLLIWYMPATAAAPYVERKGTFALGQLTKDITFHL